jgi:hypothetical protein
MKKYRPDSPSKMLSRQARMRRCSLWASAITHHGALAVPADAYEAGALSICGNSSPCPFKQK